MQEGQIVVHGIGRVGCVVRCQDFLDCLLCKGAVTCGYCSLEVTHTFNSKAMLPFESRHFSNVANVGHSAWLCIDISIRRQ